MSATKRVFIFLCVLFVSLTTGFRFYAWLYKNDPGAQIEYISQTSIPKEALSTAYLAEVLDLSVDKPVFFSEFAIEDACQKLSKSPFIEKVSIAKVCPNMLHVDYSVRQPVALLEDKNHTAVDDQGFWFPIAPYFSTEKLVKIYLGEEIETNPINSFFWHKALQVLDVWKTFPYMGDLVRLDVSKMQEDSMGKKEVVLIIKKDQHTHYLRLNTKNIQSALENYWSMQEQLQQEKPCDKIVDLRLENVAYLKEVDS